MGTVKVKTTGSDIWTRLSEAKAEDLRELAASSRAVLKRDGVQNMLEVAVRQPMESVSSGRLPGAVRWLFGFDDPRMSSMVGGLTVYAICDTVGQALDHPDMRFSWKVCLQFFKSVYKSEVPDFLIEVLKKTVDVLPHMTTNSMDRSLIEAVSPVWSLPDLKWFSQNLVDAEARAVFWKHAWSLQVVRDLVRDSELDVSRKVLPCIQDTTHLSQSLVVIARAQLGKSLARLVCEVVVPCGWTEPEYGQVMTRVGAELNIDKTSILECAKSWNTRQSPEVQQWLVWLFKAYCVHLCRQVQEDCVSRQQQAEVRVITTVVDMGVQLTELLSIPFLCKDGLDEVLRLLHKHQKDTMLALLVGLSRIAFAHSDITKDSEETIVNWATGVVMKIQSPCGWLQLFQGCAEHLGEEAVLSHWLIVSVIATTRTYYELATNKRVSQLDCVIQTLPEDMLQKCHGSALGSVVLGYACLQGLQPQLHPLIASIQVGDYDLSRHLKLPLKILLLMSKSMAQAEQHLKGSGEIDIWQQLLDGVRSVVLIDSKRLKRAQLDQLIGCADKWEEISSVVGCFSRHLAESLSAWGLGEFDALFNETKQKVDVCYWLSTKEVDGSFELAGCLDLTPKEDMTGNELIAHHQNVKAFLEPINGSMDLVCHALTEKSELFYAIVGQVFSEMVADAPVGMDDVRRLLCQCDLRLTLLLSQDMNLKAAHALFSNKRIDIEEEVRKLVRLPRQADITYTQTQTQTQTHTHTYTFLTPPLTCTAAACQSCNLTCCAIMCDGSRRIVYRRRAESGDRI